MPDWIISVLKWVGLALAAISIVALVYVQWFAVGPAPEAGAAPEATTAPVTLYVVLLIVGVVAAVAGFALGRKKPDTT